MTTPTYELHCADCLDVMRDMPDGAVDACVMLYMAHTATKWQCIVAGSHAEARSLCQEDNVTVLSCREAVGQDVTGNFGAARVVRAFKRREVKRKGVKL